MKDVLKMYMSDQVISVLSKLITKCVINETECMLTFYVTDSNTESILDGIIRICLDPVYLNKAIRKMVYYLPTLESILK